MPLVPSSLSLCCVTGDPEPGVDCLLSSGLRTEDGPHSSPASTGTRPGPPNPCTHNTEARLTPDQCNGNDVRWGLVFTVL